MDVCKFERLCLQATKTNCCYAIQDKTWVNDPDGNEWEVFVVKEDNLAESPVCCVGDDAATAESSCCAPMPVGITR